MRLLAAALALALAACSDSPCQELGEKICQCQPGLSSDSCKTLVEDQLGSKDPGEDTCQRFLDSCDGRRPADVPLCEWLLTEQGKVACGLSPAPAP
jgi:hypothetical protein